MREVQLTKKEPDKASTLNSNGIDHTHVAEQNKVSKVRSFFSKSSRTNINTLLSRAKQEKNREKKENYIFLGLICAVVTVTGIIASL